MTLMGCHKCIGADVKLTDACEHYLTSALYCAELTQLIVSPVRGAEWARLGLPFLVCMGGASIRQ